MRQQGNHLRRLFDLVKKQVSERQLHSVAVGAHCGHADQGPEMDPRSRSRLVERMAVGDGG
jgi:hypothetical protein